MQHAHGAARRFYPLRPSGPHGEPGGGGGPAALQPRARPREGAALPPLPSSTAGLRKGGRGGGRRRRGGRGLFCARGLFCSRVVVRSRFCCAFFFPSRCFVPSRSRFLARRRVVFALSGFRFALRFALLPAFSLCAPFVCFVSCALSPSAPPFLFCASLFARSSNRCPLPALSLGSHTPFPPHTLSPYPTLSPTPHSHPKLGAHPSLPTPNPSAPHVRGRSTDQGRSAGRTEEPVQLASN